MRRLFCRHLRSRHGGGLTQVEAPVYAAGVQDSEGFVVDNGVLTEYKGSAAEITIPSRVQEIGEGAFRSNRTLTSVTIPSTVTKIGGEAFAYCEKLANVSIAEGVTVIGEGAFRSCSALTELTIPSGVTEIGACIFRDCRELTVVTIPSGVTSIGAEAFYDCSKLAGIELPEGVTSIGASAFYSCDVLANAVIPESVTNIGKQAFYYCSGLKAVSLPQGLEEIGEEAFDGSGLTSITIPSHVTTIGSQAFSGASLTSVTVEEGVTALGEYMFSANGSLESVSLPAGLTEIGMGAFYNCSSLKGIDIPDGVIGIGSYAFSNCSGLLAITIPDSVKSIGESAFDNCDGLKGIAIPEGITSLSKNVFHWCNNLVSVSLPSSLKEIGEGAFSESRSLSSIRIPDGVTSIGPSAFSGCSNLTSIRIPSSVKTIGNTAFYGSGLISLVLPEGVAEIGERVFEECRSLVSITIPEGVASLENGTFSWCSKLTTVNLPSSLTSIGEQVFSSCSGIRNITIPDNVVSLGNRAFQGCSGMTGITLSSGLKSIGTSTFEDCSSLKSAEIPNGVTEIGEYAFQDCSGMTSLTLSSSLSGIKNYSFDGCSSLVEVVIPASVNNIEEYAFQNCTSLANVTIAPGVKSIGGRAFLNCSALGKIVIPEGVESIGESAFNGCSAMKSASVPASVSGIGQYAFNNCTAMNEITVAQGNRTYESENGILYDKGKMTLMYCPEGKEEVTIPADVMTIGDSAFYHNGNLMSIEIPGTVQTIGNYAFSGSALRRVKILDGVTSIGDYAFSECKDLTAIAIPESVVSIGSSAFYNHNETMTIYAKDGSYAKEYAGTDYRLSMDEMPETKKLSDCVFTVSPEEFAYDGNAKEPTVTVTDNGTVLEQGKQYTVEYKDNIEAGTGTIIVTGEDNYIGRKTLSFVIKPVQTPITKEGIVITVSPESFDYDGTAKEPEVTVTDQDKTLVLGTDYEVEYMDNVEAGTAKLTITGIGNYTGSVEKTFEIKEVEVLPLSVAVVPEELELTIGESQQLVASVTPADTEDVNLQWSVDPENIATVTADGLVNAVSAGTGIVRVVIAGTETFASAKLTVKAKPEPSEPDNKEQLEVLRQTLTAKLEAAALLSEEDYTADSWEVFVNARKAAEDGKESADIDELKGLADRLQSAMDGLVQKQPEKPDVQPKDLAECSAVLSQTEYVYDGTGKEPEVTVTDNGVTLIKGTDFTVVYQNNVEAGTAKVIVTGIGKYAGTVELTFVIQAPQPEIKNIVDCTVVLSQETYLYDGEEKKPAVTVTDDGVALVEGTDYTVEYQNNMDIGTAKVILTGLGRYTGTAEKIFQIIEDPEEEGKDIANCTAALEQTMFIYDGAEKEPKVTVRDGEAILQEGVDYELSYENNIDAGTASVIVYGEGNYYGELTLTFTIKEEQKQEPKSLYNCQILVTPQVYTYDKTEKMPVVTVQDAGLMLKMGVDFKVEYDDNLDAGTAKVTLTGIGNYTGTVVRNFVINKAVQVINCDALYEVVEGDGSFDLDADLDSEEGDLKYVSSNTNVATINSNGVVNVKSPGITTITISVGETENYMAKSETTIVEVSPKKQKLSSIKALSGRKLKLSWKKNTKVTGYIVQYSTDKKFKKNTKTLAKMKNYKKNSVTTPKLKKGKRYYVRVRSYKVVKLNGQNKTLYGEWSARKNKKVKN